MAGVGQVLNARSQYVLFNSSTAQLGRARRVLHWHISHTPYLSSPSCSLASASPPSPSLTATATATGQHHDLPRQRGRRSRPHFSDRMAGATEWPWPQTIQTPPSHTQRKWESPLDERPERQCPRENPSGRGGRREEQDVHTGPVQPQHRHGWLPGRVDGRTGVRYAPCLTA